MSLILTEIINGTIASGSAIHAFKNDALSIKLSDQYVCIYGDSSDCFRYSGTWHVRTISIIQVLNSIDYQSISVLFVTAD